MNDRYTRTAVYLHWLIALGLIGTFALGYYMPELVLSPTKLKLYSWHKWAGVTLFFWCCYGSAGAWAILSRRCRRPCRP
nr:cytochrome b/b6 domain-containing protein [Pseudomonas fluorescens]